MLDILREPDDIRIECEADNVDCTVITEIRDERLYVYVTAAASRPRFICLRWNTRFTEPTRIMGDKWERSYGDMEWHSLNGEIFMPWYFLANSADTTVGCGVMTGAGSFVSFQCDASGCTAWFDVRCGGVGVRLDGRRLLAGVVVCRRYEGISAFEAARRFCRGMCERPRLPEKPVYGSNNWYYAYGKSSRPEVIRDAALTAALAGENENRPFTVIDDGWSVNPCAGPWEPNERFEDMAEIAAEYKKLRVRPGIWIRPLHDVVLEKEHPTWCLSRINDRDQNSTPTRCLDPTVPEVREYISATIRKMTAWGYELIKHDYTTYDLFGAFGCALNGKITIKDGWSFHDETKTSAEIVSELYRLIREAAGEAIIIACNAVSHLSAGIFEVYRTGDDTSSRHWSRTRAYGVNTLAFRLCQNDAFYKIDADCVGLLPGKIPWSLNRQWLELLAESGSPLFISVHPEALNEEIKAALTQAFSHNAVQTDAAEPLDWLYNNQPQVWLVNGQKREYDFVEGSYPALLSGSTQNY